MQNGDAATNPKAVEDCLKDKDSPLEGKYALSSADQHKKRSPAIGKRGRGSGISVNNKFSNQDSQDVSKKKSKKKVVERSEKGPSRKHYMAVDVLPGTMSDDQPLSRWCEGFLHSPSIADFSDPGDSLVVRNKEKHMEPSETSPVISRAAPPGGESVRGGDIQCLLFAKTHPLWETIESMEVFRMIPQKPHFRDLKDCKELLREGFAIGSMVTFSSMVEKTSALKVDDPRSTIEQYLETIGELESLNGFNVKVVSDRLKTLLSLNSKHDELHNQSHEIGRRIGEHTVEASKFDEEIDEINKQIRELEEKRSLAFSMKEMKKSEITFLENEVLLRKEDMSEAQSEFDKLACSPWQV